METVVRGAAEGKRVVSEFKAPLTKEAYLELLRSLESEKTYHEE
jgi:hypothetical protein